MGQKGPRASFSHVTSTKIGISPQHFMTFSLNPFATLVSQIIELEPRAPLKGCCFLMKSL